MTEGPAQQPVGIPTRRRLIALASIIASSAWIVGAVNATLAWPVKAILVLMAGSFAFLLAGWQGAPTIGIFHLLAVLSLATQGAILGIRHLGWVWAVAGVVAGLLLAPIVAFAATVLVVALAHFGSSGEIHGDQGPLEGPREPHGPGHVGSETGPPR